MSQMCWPGKSEQCTASIVAVRMGFCRRRWSTDVVLEGAGLYWSTRSAQVIPRHQGQVEAVNQNDTADGDATSICCKRHSHYSRECRVELATGTAGTSTTSSPWSRLAREHLGWCALARNSGGMGW